MVTGRPNRKRVRRDYRWPRNMARRRLARRSLARRCLERRREIPGMNTYKIAEKFAIMLNDPEETKLVCVIETWKIKKFTINKKHIKLTCSKLPNFIRSEQYGGNT